MAIGIRQAARAIEERIVPDPIINVSGITKRFFLRPEQRPGSWLDAMIRTSPAGCAGRARGSLPLMMWTSRCAAAKSSDCSAQTARARPR